MTNLIDLDRALAEFLEDGPNTAPEAPVIAALAHARTTPRRPDPLRWLRSDVMASTGRSSLVMRPGLVLGLLALLALAIGAAVIGGRQPTDPGLVVPSPSGPAPTQAQPSAAPTTEPSGSAPPAPFSAQVPILVSAGQPFDITVTDVTGELIEAHSVQPGDGATVGPTDIRVVADPADSAVFLVTWQGTPCEIGGSLHVDEPGKIIEVGRQRCLGDSLPIDRIVRLRFRSAMSEGEWSSTFAEWPPAGGPEPSGSAAPLEPLGSPAVAPIHVALAHGSGNAVSIDVVDESGLLVKAMSGTVPDTEPSHQFDISNDDPTTLRLTWEGSPCDTVHRLTIDPTATGFTIDRPLCGGDAMAAWRSLVLTFSRPVSAATLSTSLVAGRGGVDMPNWTAAAPDSADKRYDLTLSDPGYVVNTIEGYYDPSTTAASVGAAGIRLRATDDNTFTVIWLGPACATTPTLAISPDGNAWRLVNEPCATSAANVVRMIDVGINLPRTTATVPSIVEVTAVAP